MLRALSTAIVGLASAGLLLASSPAVACNGECDCPHRRAAASEKKEDAKAGGDAQNILAPVDRILSATCNCSGASDCTCKKGACKCKKCQHHREAGGVQKTQLLEPLNGGPASPALPRNARLDARAGVFI